MAIAYDTVTNAATVNPGTTLTLSHAMGSVTNGVLTVHVLTTNQDITVATYNGLNMTQIGSYQSDNFATPRFLSAWIILNPASGAHNIRIDTTANALIRILSISYSGVKQTTSVDAITQNNITNSGPLSVPLTTVADNSWQVLFVRSAFGSGMSGANGGTYRTTTSQFNGIVDSNGPITPAGSASLGVVSQANDNYGWIMFSLAPYIAPVTSVPDLPYFQTRPVPIIY